MYVIFRSIQKSSHDKVQLGKFTIWVHSLVLALTMFVT